MDSFDLSSSSSSSSDECQWSPSSSPSHQEMDVNDRLNHVNHNNNRKKRSLDQSSHSSDDDDDEDGDGVMSDSEEGGLGGIDDSINPHHDNHSLFTLSTAKSSRTRRVVGLAMSRLSELEHIKSQRKLSSEENREYKKLKRQRQNRDAAANSRKKKKQKLDSLEELVNGFKKQNEELIAKLSEALKENEALKASLQTMTKKLNGGVSDDKENNDSININHTNTMMIKEESSSITAAVPVSSSSPSSSSSSSLLLNGGQSLLTVNAMDSLSNHSVESADGMIDNHDRINNHNATVDSLSSSTITTTENNDALIGSLENAYQQYQFVSMMEGLFQTIDSSIVHQPNSSEVSMADPLHHSSVSDLPSSVSGNEFFDQGLTNTLPLFRSSSLLSSISAAKDLSIDHSSLDTLYGFAPLSSAAFQDAY